MARKRKPSGRRKGGGKGYRPRSILKRSPGERFLIVCEGEKTEPNYFNSFRLPGLIHVHAEGFGVSPPQLVEVALKMKRNSSRSGGHEPFDQVWCVFDRDDWIASDFNNAIRQAENKGLKVAYSNQAFELWYLLHFHYYHNPMRRKDYENKLSELLGFPYSKNSSDMYDLLRSQQSKAVKYAKRLLECYPHPRPASDNPSTTVHTLVEELNRFMLENRKS